jgi:hypothetical protein
LTATLHEAQVIPFTSKVAWMNAEAAPVVGGVSVVLGDRSCSQHPALPPSANCGNGDGAQPDDAAQP